MSLHNGVPKKQRALVLAGGGALGAYQVGVIKALTKELVEEEKEKGEKNGLLLDIIAETFYRCNEWCNTGKRIFEDEEVGRRYT